MRIFEHSNRLEAIESRVFADEGEIPPVVRDMKKKVEGFKQKLEVSEI